MLLWRPVVDDEKSLWRYGDCVSAQQDALASFDFLNKRNSVAVNPDLREVEEELQHPALELTALHKDSEIRWGHRGLL